MAINSIVCSLHVHFCLAVIMSAKFFPNSSWYQITFIHAGATENLWFFIWLKFVLLLLINWKVYSFSGSAQ